MICNHPPEHICACVCHARNRPHKPPCCRECPDCRQKISVAADLAAGRDEIMRIGNRVTQG